ncbi:hypothetical protein B7463_g3911, partial [Scytalidium lignicola]
MNTQFLLKAAVAMLISVAVANPVPAPAPEAPPELAARSRVCAGWCGGGTCSWICDSGSCGVNPGSCN